MEKTNDYAQFKKFPGNAPLSIDHLNELIEAIQKRNLLEARPILINKNMEVVDGQHRLEAAKRLGLPIFYIRLEDLGVEDIATLNSNQRNWRMEHYLHLHCDHLKSKHYIDFKEWMTINKFSFGQAISFFIEETSINECRKKFKDGLFVFDKKYISIAENYKVLYNKIIGTTKGITRHWTQQNFIRAFLVFSTNEEIEMKRFFEQMDKYPFLMAPRSTKQTYLELFYEVYNYRRHIRVEG